MIESASSIVARSAIAFDASTPSAIWDTAFVPTSTWADRRRHHLDQVVHHHRSLFVNGFHSCLPPIEVLAPRFGYCWKSSLHIAVRQSSDGSSMSLSRARAGWFQGFFSQVVDLLSGRRGTASSAGKRTCELLLKCRCRVPCPHTTTVVNMTSLFLLPERGDMYLLRGIRRTRLLHRNRKGLYILCTRC